MPQAHPFIGGHVSASGGLYKAIENAEIIGAETIQMFGASPRQWHVRMPANQDVKKFKDSLKGSKIKSVFLHGAYLVNLASPIKETIEKSIKNLSEHFEIAQKIGANGLIFHVGSGKEMPKEKALALAALAMKRVLKNVPGEANLIIENAAGGGDKIGSNAKEIGDLMNLVGSKRVKVCFDTAHAFEAGIVEDYTPQNIKILFDEWDKYVGLENIAALHVNDSKTKFNSRHDRHENLGEGFIGMDGFKNLAKDKRLWNKAWILEVPGFDNTGPDKRNVEILRLCFSGR